MNRSVTIAIVLGAVVTSHQIADAQDIGAYDVMLEELIIPGMPGLQSFAWGEHDGQWFLVGGRTDGLHRRQPFAAFLASDNNTNAYVVDPGAQQVWSASITSLPTGLAEQLQSTNMEFEQRGNTLYCIGGYGYSATAQDHITHPSLTAIDLPGVMNAIRNGQPIGSFFRQLTDPRMEVTGGQLRLMNDRFHLVGGQRFIGRYNPQGPGFGPGFIQQYTNAIRRFGIDDDGVNLTITDYSNVVDTVNLHRRDYNMLPQIMPDGSEGLTVFSGVFQYGQDIPWLNTVDIADSTYTVVPGFEQLLNQYHTAHASLFDSSSNTMHNVFFGGIGRYYFDGGTLMDDPNVPFVNTVSLVTRDGTGALTEAAIGEMPGLLGASGEFIPSPEVPHTPAGILRMDAFSGDTVMIGHIVGGISSTASNIFFTNTGTQSDAADRMFRVKLVATAATVVPAADPTGQEAPLSVRLADELLTVTVRMPKAGGTDVSLLDSSGRVVRTLYSGQLPSGEHSFRMNVGTLAPGSYIVRSTRASGPVVVRFIR